MTKLKGTVTEISTVHVEVSKKELLHACRIEFTDSDVLDLVIFRITKQMIELDSTLNDKCVLNLNNNTWEEFWFEDYHKKENVYKTIRELNEEELKLLSTYNDLKTQLTIKGN